MSVGFGFSIGDFIAAINLLREVGSALKDQGGARDDYLKTIARLESTQTILSCVMSFEDSDKDSATVHAIHSLAHLIQSDIDRFLFKVQKYRYTLGNGESKHFAQTTLAKIKWSQALAVKVRRLYGELDGKITSLALLFDLHLSNVSAGGRKEIASAREDILDAINQNAQWSKLHTQQCSSDISVKRDISTLATDLETLVVSQSKATNDALSNMATKDDMQTLKKLFETEMRTAMANSAMSPETARLNLVLTIPQLSLSPQDMLSILQHFSTEVTALLKVLFAYVFACFGTVLLVLPHMMMVSRILRCLPSAISLVLHDNITFEDALGRVQSLQFQQFKHWNVFETSLRCAFESVPGNKIVQRGEYVLTSSNHAEPLTSENWSFIVKPGSVVKMAVNLVQIIVDGQQCPRGCRSTTEKVTTTEYICAGCGLSFVIRVVGGPIRWILPPESSGQRDSARHAVRDLKDASNMEKNVFSEWSVVFGLPSLEEEIEDLKAYKRVTVGETSKHPFREPVADLPMSDQLYQADPTGQIPPLGVKARVTATLWEDEGTLCFQVEAKGVTIARREDNDFVNGTQLLSVAALPRARRDGILRSEKTRHVVKVGPMYLKGTWIPFDRALDFANEHGITGELYPLFVHNIGALLYPPDQ